jgi:hypothetical protein
MIKIILAKLIAGKPLGLNKYGTDVMILYKQNRSAHKRKESKRIDALENGILA